MNTFIDEKVSVLIVDDHKIVRDALSHALSNFQDIEIIGTAENGKIAIEKAKKHKPDIILIDIQMPELDGISASKIISRELPDIKIVLLTLYQELILEAEGEVPDAAGYVLKEAGTKRIYQAIRKALK
ncbi:MAG: response regulator transcription factor [Actinomycetia bacterium]|nr:response regulator transcription factor [Actinomycetes bacterium]